MEHIRQNALISVYDKSGLEPLVLKMNQLGIGLYSTGGTRQFIEDLGIACRGVESVTDYPSILGGRVKTLHPKIFGGILARRSLREDMAQLDFYGIPLLDLVVVDLYPFEQTLQESREESAIIEKIDIGGVSLIRAAAKNYRDVTVVGSREEYGILMEILVQGQGRSTLEQRRMLAARAFAHCTSYDAAISAYFQGPEPAGDFSVRMAPARVLRYGENPHQEGVFYGKLEDLFDQVHGRELSYNNLVDLEAAFRLIGEFLEPTFAVIKHTNACGIASRSTLSEAWEAALAGDPESAFGGVLIANRSMDPATASGINGIFFEILAAPDFEPGALEILQGKKNRILLKQRKALPGSRSFRRMLNGVLSQEQDQGNFLKWDLVCGPLSQSVNEDLVFANLVCKHLKSNAIALVKDRQLIGKGCGQTSRVDAVRQAIAKAAQFHFDLRGAVLASDAFFPFDDSVRIAHEAGIEAVIQPGGSIRDSDSIGFCREHGMTMVLTGMRHFLH